MIFFSKGGLEGLRGTTFLKGDSRNSVVFVAWLVVFYQKIPNRMITFIVKTRIL